MTSKINDFFQKKLLKYLFSGFINNINELISNIYSKIDNAYGRLKYKIKSRKVSGPNVYFDITINNVLLGRIIFQVK